MSMAGVFVPGEGLAHRMGAGVKLLVLIGAIAVVLIAGDYRVALGALVGSLALYPLSGLGMRLLWRVSKPLLGLLVLIAALQLFTAAWTEAVRLCSQLASAVLLGGVFTRTTRVSEMLELFERLASPLRVFGVRPERIAFVLALTIRCIPLVSTAWEKSKEAHAARGLSGSPHRMVVPVLVRLIRSAEGMGEAMSARGLE